MSRAPCILEMGVTDATADAGVLKHGCSNAVTVRGLRQAVATLLAREAEGLDAFGR